MLVGTWYVIKKSKKINQRIFIIFLHYYTFSFFRPRIAFFIHGINQMIFFFMRFSIVLEPKLKKMPFEFINASFVPKIFLEPFSALSL